MSTCATSIQWLDDSPTTPCVLPKGHDGRHQYEHRYDPGTCRCVCGALDHPEWGVTA